MAVVDDDGSDWTMSVRLGCEAVWLDYMVTV
jgi:hypothetical protein